MFSTPSPSEISTTVLSDTAGHNTTATTEESSTAGNDSSSLENDQFNKSTTDVPHKTKTSEGYSGINESTTGVTSSSTARVKPKEDPKPKGWRICNDLLGGYG